MERALALSLFWAVAIVIGFFAIWIISRLSKGRVQVDLYAAVFLPFRWEVSERLRTTIAIFNLSS